MQKIFNPGNLQGTTSSIGSTGFLMLTEYSESANCLGQGLIALYAWALIIISGIFTVCGNGAARKTLIPDGI